MDERNTKISVIVPIYNAEKYLHRCIESILSQAYTDLEVLLIDDGSKDASGNICDVYAIKDNRIRVFHKENGGVSSARNLGLDKAAGQYITFIDADDYFEPKTIVKDLFKEDFDVIQFPRNNGSFMKSYSHDKVCKDKSSFRKFINRNFYFECWGRLYKRNVIGANRFMENIRIGEDLLFFLQVYPHVNSFYLHSTGGKYHYSYVKTSAMHKKDVGKEQYELAKLVNSKYRDCDDILALTIMIDFFYDKKVCDVRELVFSYPLWQVVKLPISLKHKMKYLLDRFFN